ncbi:MAG: 2-thiouracil desulfurase family protein, partial [Clostridia bacterium]|nr:2-thiouracil desulfurase family protein [Clostridia bacterium]
MVYARPRILVSSCLGFEDCDIRGQKHKSLLVDELKGFAELIPVCPEMAMGLGSPRQSIRIVLKNDEPRLIQPTTG